MNSYTAVQNVASNWRIAVRAVVIILAVMMSGLFSLSALASSNSAAMDIFQLEKRGQVEVKAWLDRSQTNKTEPYAINQQIIMYIEVATPRWFTGGTLISNIDLPNVIVKQRNRLATNYTERKNGQTWSRQRWEITLYPQQSGAYVIPATGVELQVSVPGGLNVRGRLYTPPLSFSVALPSGRLNSDGDWAAASELKAEQVWDSSNEELAVGDVITRTVQVKGKDTLSVLIPLLIPEDPSSEYQAYPQPHRLKDTQERGNYRSSRQEQVMYVLQAGGDVHFPALNIQWWNTQTQQVETLQVAGKTFTVRHTFQSLLNTYWQQLMFWGGIGLGVVLLIGVLTRYYRTHPLPALIDYGMAVNRRQWTKAKTMAYNKFRNETGLLELGGRSTAAQWQQLSIEFQLGQPSRRLFWQVWRRMLYTELLLNLKKQCLRLLHPLQLLVPAALPQLKSAKASKKRH